MVSGPASFSALLSSVLEARYPPALANAGDTVGVTIASLKEVERGGTAVVVLCTDLTEVVLQDAISLHADRIITYSPMPHQPLRTIGLQDPTGRIVLKCAQQCIAEQSVEAR